MKFRWFTCAAVLSAFLAGTNGSAEAITWTFAGPGSEGSIGNSRSFTSEGITVTATAWSYTSSGFQAARLGLWSTGLGVCNQAESCGNPAHQADNAGRNEFVLFQFSSAVDPLSVRIDPYGSYDRDVSYWTGNVTLPSDLLAGETYSSLTSSGVGFFSRIDNNGSISSSPRNVSITSPFVTTLLFGPRYNGGGDDYFKITSLTGTASVPEPSSVLLLGLGLLGLVWLQRKSYFTV
jgi:PEP-CTERM motif